MRLVVLTQYYPPEIGAPQTRLAAIVRELVRRGHDVEVVTAVPNYPTGTIAEGYRRRLYVRELRDGVRVHRTWMYASMGRGAARLAGYLSFTVLSVLGLVRCRRPTHVLIESPPLFLGVTGIAAARLWRATALLNVADLWPDAAVELGAIPGGPALDAARWLERWLYRHADVVCAATEGLAAAIRSRVDDAGKVVLLPNGADTDLFRPDAGDPAVLDELGLPSDGLFVHAGTMSYIHGLETVIEAAARTEGVTLALVGAGSNEPELRQLVERLGATNVRFVPPQPLENLARLLPLAAAGVVSVRDIPQAMSVRPSKLYPVLASGVPVLYAGQGEGAELLRQAGSGEIVPNGDIEAVRAAFERLRGGDADAGARGREWVLATLSWRSIIERWLAELARRGR
jgi:glycosyltransferase involved in cell wall biosynthesis